MIQSRTLLLALTFIISACAGTYQTKVNFNPAEPIRIAVLPFIQTDAAGNIVKADADLLIDDLSLVSSKRKQTPAKFLQSVVQSELTKTSLDLVSPAVVEAQLLHNGFDINGSDPVEIDLDKVLRAAPSELCEKILSCDAVLYGKVTDWQRNYYVLQTNNAIAFDLKLVSARDGNVLFESKATDSDSRGLSKGPTGFSNLVIEPIRGLDNSIISGLARKMVGESLKNIITPSRPEFLNVSPPAIFASAHDSSKGLVDRNRGLTVIALGSPKAVSSFSIGSVIENIPMIERDPGHYIGEYVPLSTDKFEDQRVSVKIHDDYGRATVQQLGKVLVTLR